MKRKEKEIEVMSGLMTELNEIASLIYYQAKDKELDTWLTKAIANGWWEPAHDENARNDLIRSIRLRSYHKAWDTPRN